MKKIPLTQGKFAIVDDEDYRILSGYKWHVRERSNTFYARRFVRKGVAVEMHREIMDFPKCLEVDHRDGNGLNNLRANLRVATHSENMRNSCISKNNKTGFKGVSFAKREQKYRAVIYVESRMIHLGYFPAPEEAYAAYCAGATSHHGEFARLK